MKYSEDYKIGEWTGRHDEIERILHDIDCSYTNICECADIISELEQNLRKRKKVIEKHLDRKGTDLH